MVPNNEPVMPWILDFGKTAKKLKFQFIEDGLDAGAGAGIIGITAGGAGNAYAADNGPAGFNRDTAAQHQGAGDLTGAEDQFSRLG